MKAATAKPKERFLQWSGELNTFNCTPMDHPSKSLQTTNQWRRSSPTPPAKQLRDLRDYSCACSHTKPKSFTSREQTTQLITFNNESFEIFATQIGFKHRRITPVWPRDNVEAERPMKTLKKAVRTAVIQGKNWRQELFTFLRQCTATPPHHKNVSFRAAKWTTTQIRITSSTV